MKAELDGVSIEALVKPVEACVKEHIVVRSSSQMKMFTRVRSQRMNQQYQQGARDKTDVNKTVKQRMKSHGFD